jgi:hypothetical protein
MNVQTTNNHIQTSKMLFADAQEALRELNTLNPIGIVEFKIRTAMAVHSDPND